ncbi:MAG: methyltransferase [Trueperella sp.]|nr:methyltransferase [Trueperella sp.]
MSDTFTQLLQDEGWELVNSLPPYNPDAVLTLHERLAREGYSPDLISAALTQSRLRERARAKFGDFARQMAFTENGLQQATRLQVAALHAQRLIAAGSRHIIDFGCGIGADSMAMAGLGLHVTAIEADADAAAAAAVNLRAFPEAQVVQADGFELDLSEFAADGIWLDPARRRGNKRLQNPDDWSPSLEQALALARQFPSAGIKVAPGIDYALLPRDARVEWIAVAGDLVEAVIWIGAAAAPDPGRGALVVDDAGFTTWDARVTDPRLPAVQNTPQKLNSYIFEPNPAIIRSGSIATVCADFGLSPVSESIAYLTGPDPISSPLLQTFQVHSVLPIDAKKIRKVLRQLNVGSVEIKKRGTDLDPELFRKKLKLDTSQPAELTLIATPLLGKHRLVLAQRI